MDLLTKSHPALPLIGWIYWLSFLCLTQTVYTLALVMSLFGSFADKHTSLFCLSQSAAGPVGVNNPPELFLQSVSGLIR